MPISGKALAAHRMILDLSPGSAVTTEKSEYSRIAATPLAPAVGWTSVARAMLMTTPTIQIRLRLDRGSLSIRERYWSKKIRVMGRKIIATLYGKKPQS